MKKLVAAFSLIVLIGLAFQRQPHRELSEPAPPVIGQEEGQSSSQNNGAPPGQPADTPSRQSGALSAKQQPSSFAAEKKQNDMVIDENGNSFPLRTYKALALPNDPQANQWWVPITGAEAAWGMGEGSGSSLLAIIDSGIALNHEEYSGRIHTNSGEAGVTATESASLLNCTEQGLAVDASCNVIDDDFDGIIDNETGQTTFENTSLLNCSDQAVALDKSCNLVDDDGNGLIDDRHGFDFTAFERSVMPGETNPAGTGTKHGTAVTGVAAATGGNGSGLAGADWYSKILPLQALDDDDRGNTITVSRAIRYAADQGADVINISLGSVEEDAFVRDAVAYALSRGSLVVAAAGNDGCDCMLYPAAYEEVVAVGALSNSSQPASFSSYGATLDVLAPGTDMYSTSWSADNPTGAYASGLAGTSFASPYVAGLLSSMKAHMPSASTQQLVALLVEQTDRMTLASSQAHSPTIGHGMVDAVAMVNRIENPANLTLRYGFRDLSLGTRFGPYEQTGKALVYKCEGSRPGPFKAYKLQKGADTLYTVSAPERRAATEDGYSSTQFGNGFCITLPVDAPASLRLLSIAREFDNNFTTKW